MIPRKIIENTYGINIQKPKENEDQNRPPTSEEMLSAYASKFSFQEGKKTFSSNLQALIITLTVVA